MLNPKRPKHLSMYDNSNDMKPKRYKRYTSKYQDNRVISKERTEFENTLIADFVYLYQDKSKLNVKIDKVLFDGILDDVGFYLKEFASKAANDCNNYKEIHKKLENNPAPHIADEIMTKEFRIFCLTLNALKQWVSAEQASLDRILLGGQYKKKLREQIKECIVTKTSLESAKKDEVNFHHTMRDGRFPIPITKDGHLEIEGQSKKKPS